MARSLSIAIPLMMMTMDYSLPPVPRLSVTQATLFFLFMEDFYQYFAHRLLHWGIFYKKIHKLHHEHSAPFGLAAQYAHPLETLILGFGFFLGPLIWVSFYELHVVTMVVWLTVRLLQVVDAHSGYDFPWSLHNFLPFWAGADFHDYHHMAFKGNYSSSFRWWDWICGTDSAYHQWKAKRQALRAASTKKSE
jgi:methylsterol monooxygenase